MNSSFILRDLAYLEVVMCVAALWVLVQRKQWSDYSALGLFLALRIFSATVLLCDRTAISYGLSKSTGYRIYFYVYWPSFAVESILALIVVYSIFKLAMAPLKGLQALGMLVFKWAAGISIAVALGSAFSPGLSGTDLAANVISQLQRTQSILTLCLLLFVCFAIRPMGLSYSSRVFGVSLGLGVMATNNLVQSAWLTFHPDMDTAYSVINGIVICLILATWITYFALPEPKRRIIVLPTTSPFLRWNQISQALGDDPGFVAIGGVPPEMFAPAEIEVMCRASRKMAGSFPKQTDGRLASSRAI